MALGAKRRIGEEDDPARHSDGFTKGKSIERLNVDRHASQRTPIPPGVLDQRRTAGNPDRPAATAVPLVEDDARALTAFADTGAVSDEEARPVHGAVRILVALVARLVGREGDRKSVVSGKDGGVRLDRGGSRLNKKKTAK